MNSKDSSKRFNEEHHLTGWNLLGYTALCFFCPWLPLLVLLWNDDLSEYGVTVSWYNENKKPEPKVDTSESSEEEKE